ncbi:GTP-binding protein, partial [Streptomyces sp. NPDC005568]|uniref:GTP-binding protein n=1 Tax=Streptomyces sp. NPDC005568 TaxID=3156887 RepID=UPI0033B5225C
MANVAIDARGVTKWFGEGDARTQALREVSMQANFGEMLLIVGPSGSGKTTLLKRILNEQHGMKIAVIENEFGEENIDNEILIQDSNEQIIQMSNGCICCTIRGDLARTLGDLAAKKREGKLDFDRIVIETTGLANPGPVAQTFFIDSEIADDFLLDAVITLVDAKHANAQLDEHEVVQRQVGFADRLFITKSDLVDDQTVAGLKHRLMHMNPKAAAKKKIKQRIA